MVVSALAGGEGAFIHHLGSAQFDGGQVPDGPLVLVEQAVFLPGEYAAVGLGVSAREGQVKDFPQLAVRLVGSPAAQGIGIKEQAVSLVGDHHRNADFGIVLVQFLRSALVVEFPGLVLSQAVEGFVGGGSITHRGAPELSVGLKGAAAVLGQEGAVGPEEAHHAIGLGHFHPKGVRRKHHLARLLGQLEVRAALLGQYHQALAVVEAAVGAGRYPDNLRTYHLQAKGAGLRLYQNLILGAAGTKAEGRKKRVECKSHIISNLSVFSSEKTRGEFS